MVLKVTWVITVMHSLAACDIVVYMLVLLGSDWAEDGA